MSDAQPRCYHQREWLQEFGHPRPHIHAARWIHAADERDLDMIQALTEHGRQVGESLKVWPTFQGTSSVVRLGDWVMRDDHGNVFVIFDAHFRARYEECHRAEGDAACERVPGARGGRER